MDKTKVCRHCGIDKPLEDYRTVPRGRLGVGTICRNCDNAIRKAERVRKPKYSSKGIPRGVGFGNTPMIDIDSEVFPTMIYEIKNKTIIVKTPKGKIVIPFQYVDVFAKEIQEIKNTYFGIRI